MRTIIEKITYNNDKDTKIIEQGAGIIAEGGLVAFPTETVYGLGGNAFDPEAAAKIYAAKGRPSDNPLIVHISEVGDLYKVCDNVPECAMRLADAFWPGPLTMIVPKNDRIPKTVTGGLDTVAVRLPAHPVARKLIAASGTFIAAPSANLSGRPSPTNASHVIDDLDGRIDMIIDDGSIEIGLESTIVDLTEDIPVILRPGYITEEMLKSVTNNVRLDPALMTGVRADVRPKAPGMKYRHYAPKASLTIIEGERENVISAIQSLVDEDRKRGWKVGVLSSSEDGSCFEGAEVITIGSRNNKSEVAAHLFDALRRFDDLEVDEIYSEAFDDDGIGRAVMNRLLKAAGQKVIKV